MDELLPTDLATLCYALAAYPFPHLKKLVYGSDLYMPFFLKDNNAAVEACTERLVFLIESKEVYNLYYGEVMSGEYFNTLLETLWSLPAQDIVAFEFETADYRDLVAALNQDGIDVSQFPLV